MDVYWSIERCRWVPSRPPQDPLATPWSVAQAPEDRRPVPDLPLQREPQRDVAGV